jgi:DeoR family transcriptional regulator, suf operon transcriptional repressor
MSQSTRRTRRGFRSGGSDLGALIYTVITGFIVGDPLSWGVPQIISPLDLLPDGRREVLRLLKLRGPLSAGEAARDLSLTVSGVRQHLAALEGAGLVGHSVLPSGRGRPRHVYTLSTSGDALFPRRHGDLAGELLGYLEEESEGMLSSLFARRSRRRADDARPRLRGTLAERVTELARILDEDGYLAEVQELWPTGFLLVERNCAVLAVAQRYPQVCSSEIDFIREALPDAHVRRVSHIVRGDTTCAYEVTPRDPSSPLQLKEST